MLLQVEVQSLKLLVHIVRNIVQKEYKFVPVVDIDVILILLVVDDDEVLNVLIYRKQRRRINSNFKEKNFIYLLGTCNWFTFL